MPVSPWRCPHLFSGLHANDYTPDVFHILVHPWIVLTNSKPIWVVISQGIGIYNVPFLWQQFISVVVNHYHHHYPIIIINHYQSSPSSLSASTLSSPWQWDWSLNLPSPNQHCYNHIITWLSSSFVVTIFNTYTYINSITVIVSLHRVTITYWLAFITHTEKHNDPNFLLSLSPKHYRRFHLLHEPP